MTEVDLSKCAVCGGPAQFTDADPGANPVSYDSTHLPEHFRARAAAGQLPLQSGATVTELREEARELDIEGRSSLVTSELETAVSAAHATELAQDASDPRIGVEAPDAEPRPTPEAESVGEQYVTERAETTEGGSMSDAPVVLEEPKKAPRKAPRKK